MNFQELSVFVEIADAGGISAAAERMGLAKSAVSTQLFKLEERLGVKLFTRTSRRVNLTQEGRQLLPRVVSLIAEGEQLLEQAEQEVARPSGVVRIAVTPDLGARFIENLVPRITSIYPEINLVVKLGYDLENIQDPSFDLAIRTGHISDEGLVASKLGKYKRIFVASPDYLKGNLIRKPEDLLSVNALVFSNQGADRIWRVRPCSTSNSIALEKQVKTLRVRGLVSIDSFSSLMQLACRHQGVALIPTFIADDLIQRGELENCLPDWESFDTEVMLAYRFGASRVTRVEVVINLIKEIVPSLLTK